MTPYTPEEIALAADEFLDALAPLVERMHNDPKGLLAGDIKAIAMEIIDIAVPLRGALRANEHLKDRPDAG